MAYPSAFRGKRRLVVMAALALLLVPAALVWGQAGGGYDLSWNTVAGGGGTTGTGGVYGIGGTAGQSDAGSMSGGIFAVSGGFWSAAVTPILVGHVTWQGRPAQPNPLQQLPITLTLRLQSGGPDDEYAGLTTDASGFFTATVANLAGGAYNWRVKGPKYLAGSGALTLTGSSVTNSEMGLLRAGDCNNDNLVNSVDFNILKATFGKAIGDPGYDDRADFNGDQRVNSVDFNPQKGNFGTGGAPPIMP